MFADDTILFFKSSNLNECVDKINYDLAWLYTYSNKNHLKVNIKKSKVMIFSRNFDYDDSDNINILISDERLEIVNVYKYLGFL